MKIRSIQSNYLLSIIRLISGLLISILTIPYITRILGPQYLGKVEYVNSIIMYFVLFSGLGIPLYGIKEVAKVRNNAMALTRLIVEIFILLLGTSIISYLILFIALFFLNISVDYKALIIILSSMILLTNIGFEWLYQGIEDQLYITIRTVIIRILSIFLLYLLVKNQYDYLWYAFIVVINTAGGNVFNFLKVKQYIDFSHLKNYSLNIKQHIKPALTMFLASVSVSIYLQVDSLLLGYLSGDEAVGYYSIANKILRIIILLVTTVGIVMLPRLTYLWQNDKVKYYMLLSRSINFLLLISIPSSLFIYFYSNQIIYIMGGARFNDSIIILKILSPIIVFVSIAYFMGYLVLFIQNKDKIYAQIIAISAFISIFINYFLIIRYQQNGAAIGQLVAEFLGMFLLCITVFQQKLLKNKLYGFRKSLFNIFMANIVSGLVMFYLASINIVSNIFLNLFVNMIVISIIYIILLIFLKEKIILDTVRLIGNGLISRWR